MTRREDEATGFKKVADFMHPTEWRDLCARIRSLIRGAKEAYVGRTCSPPDRHAEHAEAWGCDRLVCVYRHHEKSIVCDVEEALIVATGRHLKRRNRSSNSVGPYRHGVNYIYVAVKFSRPPAGRRS